MITQIFSNSPYIRVDQAEIPYINSGPMSGQMRFNPNTRSTEVSDGSSWRQVGGLASISVTDEFTKIMDWARAEMLRSERIRKLAEESVTVADALIAYEEAAEKLKVIATLADKETV